MTPEAMLTLQVLASIGSLLSGLAVLISAVGIFLLIKQTRANELSATATIYQAITTTGNSIADTFIDHPEVWAALFPKTVEQVSDDGPLQVRLRIAAMKYVDWLDYSLEYAQALPPHLRPIWRTFAKDILTTSPYTLNFARTNHEWYGREINSLLQEIPASPVQPITD